MRPERTRHLTFGAVAAVWGLLSDLGVAAVIDDKLTEIFQLNRQAPPVRS
jgi:hypothetical protein